MKMRQEITELMAEKPELFKDLMRTPKHLFGVLNLAQELTQRVEQLYLTAHTFRDRKEEGLGFGQPTTITKGHTSLRLFFEEPRILGGYPKSDLIETYVKQDHMDADDCVGEIVVDEKRTRELADKHQIFRGEHTLPHQEYLRRLKEVEPDLIDLKAGGVLLPGIRKDVMEPEIIIAGPETHTLNMVEIPEVKIYHIK